MSLPLYAKNFMPGNRGNHTPIKIGATEVWTSACRYSGSHGTTTCAVEHDPKKTTFTPVSWQVISVDLPDEMSAPKQFRASNAGKLSGAKGGRDHKTTLVPTMVMIAHTTRVIRDITTQFYVLLVVGLLSPVGTSITRHGIRMARLDWPECRRFGKKSRHPPKTRRECDRRPGPQSSTIRLQSMVSPFRWIPRPTSRAGDKDRSHQARAHIQQHPGCHDQSQDHLPWSNITKNGVLLREPEPSYPGAWAQSQVQHRRRPNGRRDQGRDGDAQPQRVERITNRIMRLWPDHQ